MTRIVRQAENRVGRRGVCAWALAAVVCACTVAAGPAGPASAAGAAGAAGSATAGYPPGPGAPAPPAPLPPAPPVVTPPADGAPAPAPAASQPADGPRPVAELPTAGGGEAASDASLAIRRLTVTARVELTDERPARLTVTFVPRPGSLVAQVRVSARRDASRRLLVSKLVGVRSGRRATVRLRATGMTPGTYDVSVRAGASRMTLGPAVVARLTID